MKYIFDFDDVLFHNTKLFKEHMYACLEKAGVPRSLVEPYYKKLRVHTFWLKDLLLHFSLGQNVYDEILDKSVDFVNKDLIDIVKRLGKENCYILTSGGKEFQLDKINRTQLSKFFSEIYVVPGSKREVIYDICAKHKEETVFFIDDKIKFIEDIDLAKCPNLKTILFTSTAQLHDALPDLFPRK